MLFYQIPYTKTAIGYRVHPEFCAFSQVTMQFLGRLLDTVSSVSTLFTNPYRVREVPLSDYGGGGKVLLKEEGRIYLYKNTQSQSWDCLLTCPETPTVALRSVLVTSQRS